MKSALMHIRRTLLLQQKFAADTMVKNPYIGNDPGPGLQKITLCELDTINNFHNWKPWRTNDGRVLPNSKSSFSLLENPFGEGHNILLTTYYNPDNTGRPFGGYGIRAPIIPSVPVNNKTFFEMDFYYPRSAANKYMRFEIWSTSSGGAGLQSNLGSPGTNKAAIYIRMEDLEGTNIYNIDYKCGYYNDETWFKKSVSAVIPVQSGNWEYLNIDLHTEGNAEVTGDILMIGNIKITCIDPAGVPIPNVENTKKFSKVEPIKKKYNPDNGYFLVGTDGVGDITPDTIGGYHFELFVSHRNLKPERHIKPPQWLKKMYPDFVFDSGDGEQEWDLPTDYYLNIINGCKQRSNKKTIYKLHGHCLAWINQSPAWMSQIIPENIIHKHWNSSGKFYTDGYNATGSYQKVNKETARRIYFDHIMYEMRHFMTVDPRYNSSKERGIIPFHSFDVVNADVHEARHSFPVFKNENEWKTLMKNASWMMAMTDNEFDYLRQHYIYLLYKYAHIAVPNAQMAERYKEGYNNPDIVPQYMKMDNHDINGSIDAYITEKPPILIYNDYDIISQTKLRIIYCIIKELNIAWKTDPLYDGRNLIECMGIQGHDTVSPVLASLNQQSISIFTELIDEGLLDTICYSEIDIRQPAGAPGGKAMAPDILNQKQADVIGYQYALLFKLFDKYKKYIDHVIIWNQHGSGWANSYVLFDHKQMASQAYYAIMDPDKFIKGHSYLDSYFAGEYEKIQKPML
jgi:GH35 family endo-1,4-beta-xylanase